MSNQAKPEFVRQSLLWVQVCVPESLTDEQVEEWTNAEHPTGINSSWTIDRNQEKVRAGCEERGGCVHLVLNC